MPKNQSFMRLADGSIWHREGWFTPTHKASFNGSSSRVSHPGHYTSQSTVGGGGSPALAIPIVAAGFLLVRLVVSVLSDSGPQAAKSFESTFMKELSKSNGTQQSGSQGQDWQFYTGAKNQSNPFVYPVENRAFERFWEEHKSDIIDVGIDFIDDLDENDNDKVKVKDN